MSFPSIFSAGIQADLTNLVLEWGKSSDISRLVASTNAQGRESGSFVNQISGEILWVQPIAGGSFVADFDINDQTTHIAYQQYSGFVMLPKDRVTVAGDSFAFDVVLVHLKESHRVTELKQISRA